MQLLQKLSTQWKCVQELQSSTMLVHSGLFLTAHWLHTVLHYCTMYILLHCTGRSSCYTLHSAPSWAELYCITDRSRCVLDARSAGPLSGGPSHCCCRRCHPPPPPTRPRCCCPPPPPPPPPPRSRCVLEACSAGPLSGGPSGETSPILATSLEIHPLT